MKQLLSILALLGMFAFVGCAEPEAKPSDMTAEQEEAYGQDVAGSGTKEEGEANAPEGSETKAP